MPSLRPHGRSGLKFFRAPAGANAAWSPPTRAEWIEIPEVSLRQKTGTSLRPHGRSGLKFATQFGVF